jgi:hypothetical protein
MDATTATIAQTIGRCEPLQPAWVRIPDAIKFGGVGRSKLYQLVDEGQIRSVCLREQQKVRGIRLINVQSLLDYIESFEGNGKGQGNAKGKKNARQAGKRGRAKAAN